MVTQLCASERFSVVCCVGVGTVTIYTCQFKCNIVAITHWSLLYFASPLFTSKDLVRRMLKLDPAERASIPEITSYCWLRSVSTSIVDFSHRDTHATEQMANKVSRDIYDTIFLLCTGHVKVCLGSYVDLACQKGKET